MIQMIGIVLAATGVVSFKDAGKIKSWDAWDDHLAKAAVTNVVREVICAMKGTLI